MSLSSGNLQHYLPLKGFLYNSLYRSLRSLVLFFSFLISSSTFYLLFFLFNSILFSLVLFLFYFQYFSQEQISIQRMGSFSTVSNSLLVLLFALSIIVYFLDNSLPQYFSFFVCFLYSYFFFLTIFFFKLFYQLLCILQVFLVFFSAVKAFYYTRYFSFSCIFFLLIIFSFNYYWLQFCQLCYGLVV